MPAQNAAIFRAPDLQGPDFKDIARRWQALAERRLASYDELYRSGRWKHYYASQEEFAARMLDVIKAAKAYQKLVVDSPSVVPHQEPPHQEPPHQEPPHQEPLRSASPRREPLRPAA
jgi:hypothetical protein